MPYRSQYNQNHSSLADAFYTNNTLLLHTGNHQHQGLTLHQLLQQPNTKPFAAQQPHQQTNQRPNGHLAESESWIYPYGGPEKTDSHPAHANGAANT